MEYNYERILAYMLKYDIEDDSDKHLDDYFNEIKRNKVKKANKFKQT